MTIPIGAYLCRRAGVAIAIGLVLIAILGVCSALGVRERCMFYWLRINRRDATKAEAIATALKESSVGIQCAAADVDVFGGTTCGWSTWILLNSTRKSEVISSLNNSADVITLSRRLESLMILWHRTSDPDYLISYFRLIRLSGSPVVGRARIALSAIVDSDSIRGGLRVPADLNLAITEQEFAAALASKSP